MERFSYVRTGTYLFRFMDHRTAHFWPTIVDMLSGHTLFLNSRKNFNDPFDSQPIIENDLSNSALRCYFNKALENPFNPNRSTVATARLLEMRARGETTLAKHRMEEIKEGLRKSAQEMLDRAGLLSFSLVAEDPVLWGHYAASFTGVCAVFKRGTSLQSAFAICANVSYVNERPRLLLSAIQELARRRMDGDQHDDLAHEVFYLSFLHKSRHWAYEQEARIFHPFHALQKIPFDQNELIGFILGPNSSEDLQTRFRSEIKARRPTVSLDRTSLSQTKFRIVIPHKFRQQAPQT